MYSVLANPHPVRTSPREVGPRALGMRRAAAFASGSYAPPSFVTGGNPARVHPSSPPQTPLLVKGSPSTQTPYRLPHTNAIDTWTNRAEDERLLKLWKFQEETQAHLEMIRSISDNIDKYTTQMLTSNPTTQGTWSRRPKKDKTQSPPIQTPKSSPLYGVKTTTSPRRTARRSQFSPRHKRQLSEESVEPVLHVEPSPGGGMGNMFSSFIGYRAHSPLGHLPVDLDIAIAKKEIRRLIILAKRKLERKRREREARRVKAEVTGAEDNDDDYENNNQCLMDIVQKQKGGRLPHVSTVLPTLASLLMKSSKITTETMKEQSTMTNMSDIPKDTRVKKIDIKSDTNKEAEENVSSASAKPAADAAASKGAGKDEKGEAESPGETPAKSASATSVPHIGSNDSEATGCSANSRLTLHSAEQLPIAMAEIDFSQVSMESDHITNDPLMLLSTLANDLQGHQAFRAIEAARTATQEVAREKPRRPHTVASVSRPGPVSSAASAQRPRSAPLVKSKRRRASPVRPTPASGVLSHRSSPTHRMPAAQSSHAKVRPLGSEASRHQAAESPRGKAVQWEAGRSRHALSGQPRTRSMGGTGAGRSHTTDTTRTLRQRSSLAQSSSFRQRSPAIDIRRTQAVSTMAQSPRTRRGQSSSRLRRGHHAVNARTSLP